MNPARILKGLMIRPGSGRVSPVKQSSTRARPGPHSARSSWQPYCLRIQYVYEYIVYVDVILTRVYALWRKNLCVGNRKTKYFVLNTTVIHRHSIYVIHRLLHMYSYYSIFIVAILLDMTSQMLYCTLPIASIVSN